MIQPNELINLAISAMVLPVVYLAMVRRNYHPARVLFFAAYCAMVCAQTFTIIEGFALPDLFNAGEHTSYTVSGALFLLAFLRLAPPRTPRLTKGSEA